MYTQRIDYRTVSERTKFDLSSVVELFVRPFSYESSKENSPRSKSRASSDGAISETALQRARAELKVLEQERTRLDKQRQNQLKDFENSKTESRRLLEVRRKSFLCQSEEKHCFF